MLKSILNLNGVNKINKEQQKRVRAGRSLSGRQYFDCHCGFVGGSGESHAYIFPADSISDALSQIGDICNGQGGTCRGLG